MTLLEITSHIIGQNEKLDQYSLAKIMLINKAIIENRQFDNDGWCLVGNIDKKWCEIRSKPYKGKEQNYYVSKFSEPYCIKWKIV